LRRYIEAKDKQQQEGFDKTIDIHTEGVGTTEFQLSKKRKSELYESGRDAAERFLVQSE